MRRPHAALAHRTVRYHTAVASISWSVWVGLMVSRQLLERSALVRSLDLEIFRRRFSAVAHDFELDLLTFIERGQTGFLHSGNVNKYILSATLWLNESIALGRIEPLHGTSRHVTLPEKQRSQPTVHIPAAVAIHFLATPKRRPVVSATGTACQPRAGRSRPATASLLVNRRSFVGHLDCFAVAKVPDGPARL